MEVSKSTTQTTTQRMNVYYRRSRLRVRSTSAPNRQTYRKAFKLGDVARFGNVDGLTKPIPLTREDALQVQEIMQMEPSQRPKTVTMMWGEAAKSGYASTSTV
jgi:hypothetical protein